jgi:AcrR family transcriptional regulator
VSDVVPDALRRLWGLAEPSRLGRPAALDLGSIVSTAGDLADADGLAGVTLPKVAKALGFTPMSLYRYVGSKDELLVLMTDTAVGVPPQIEDTSWREGLTRWAVAQWQLFRRRPWLARMPISGSPSGPNQIAWMESALAVLKGTGLDWTRKVGVLNLVGGYVRHAAVQADDLAAARAPGVGKAEAERDYGRALAQLVDPERFPQVAELFASTVFEAPAGNPEDSDFTIGLEFVLDGIAAAVARC